MLCFLAEDKQNWRNISVTRLRVVILDVFVLRRSSFAWLISCLIFVGEAEEKQPGL